MMQHWPSDTAWNEDEDCLCDLKGRFVRVLFNLLHYLVQCLFWEISPVNGLKFSPCIFQPALRSIQQPSFELGDVNAADGDLHLLEDGHDVIVWVSSVGSAEHRRSCARHFERCPRVRWTLCRRRRACRGHLLRRQADGRLL